ncbi:toxic anion resistance protein [Paenibacillus sp. IB182496]|uniref:Toxic anion resistance protein n=1 Tax=Paenibacillus sabuli TaxID=2772509 RepID=A0A927BV10_9BACL|nr:toxic anion resistance protein [Paenibacillus sabuli]MBD2845979.1 toxic anion resistance protein [Paenibacillus sabuli]
MTTNNQDRGSRDLAAIVEQLGPREREEARRLSERLSLEDSASVSRFGNDIQEEIAEFAGSILAQVRSGRSGEVGETVTELILAVQQVPAELSGRKRALGGLPIVGKWLGGAKRALQQTQTLEVQVDTIRGRLDEAYIMLQKDIQLLDLVLKRNHEYFRRLELHIAAVQLRLREAEREERPRLSALADEGTDPWDGQRLGELDAFIRRLEVRLDDFNRTRFLSLTQAPRIRLLQQGEQLMMEKIQSVIYNLIPLWKMDLVAGLAQERVGRALEVHDRVKEHIETGMRRGAERTRELSVEIAARSEEGMIGMDTLRSVHQELVSTLEDTMAIYGEGRDKRREAEAELVEMERELKRRIAEIAELPPRAGTA